MKTLTHTDLLKSELYIEEKDLLDNEQHEQEKEKSNEETRRILLCRKSFLFFFMGVQRDHHTSDLLAWSYCD